MADPDLDVNGNEGGGGGGTGWFCFSCSDGFTSFGISNKPPSSPISIPLIAINSSVADPDLDVNGNEGGGGGGRGRFCFSCTDGFTSFGDF